MWINTVVDVDGFGIPALIKSLASTIQMPDYNRFFQKSEVQYLRKAKQSAQALGLKPSCPVKETQAALSLSPGLRHQASFLRVAGGAGAAISPRKEKKSGISPKVSQICRGWWEGGRWCGNSTPNYLGTSEGALYPRTIFFQCLLITIKTCSCWIHLGTQLLTVWFCHLKWSVITEATVWKEVVVNDLWVMKAPLVLPHN